MKRLLMFALCMAVFMMSFTGRDSKAADFFIAPDGNDTDSGTIISPWHTLPGARDALRKLRKAGPLGTVPINVNLRQGQYNLSSTFLLQSEDSGMPGAPIVYRAYKDEPVYITGGRQIDKNAFAPVMDDKVLSRLDEKTRSHLLRADLKALGFADFPEFSSPEMNGGATVELFYNGQRMTLARWPNQDWAKCGKIIDKGSMPRWGDKENRGGTFEFQGNRPERWKTAEQLWLHGYWFHDWADEAIKVEHIDTEKNQITLATPHSYGLKQDQRYYALNLLEEIDSPGEWFLDRKEKILYFWPPDNFDKANVQLSLLRAPLLELKDASQVHIEGLIFEVSGGSAISIQGGDENLIAGSTFRNLGTSAISISLGRHNGVVSCDIYNIGSTGIALTGGDRKTLTPAEHYALNNHIHHFAQRKKTYRPAISLNGVGNRMAHNLIHDAPHAAVLYGGNEHVMEYNDVHSVCLETSDVGVFYCGRDWTLRGNEVRYNYFHDVPSLPGHGSMTVYLDDSASSTRIFGNIFYHTRYSAFIGGGRDNIVQNNIFIECDKPIHIDARGIGWAAKYQQKGADHRMYKKLEEVNYNNPPWSTRYPKLARILDENPHEPRGNIVIENVSVRSSWQDPDKRWARLENNFLTSDDPGFVNFTNRDFRLKEDALVYKKIPDFKPIPFEKIGLYLDQYRSQTPGNN